MLKFNISRLEAQMSLISDKSPESFVLSFIKNKLHTYPRGVHHCWNLQQWPRFIFRSSENITLYYLITSWTWLILDRRDGNTEQAATGLMSKVSTQHSTQTRCFKARSWASMKSSLVQLGEGNGERQHSYFLAYIPQNPQTGRRWFFFSLHGDRRSEICALQK